MTYESTLFICFYFFWHDLQTVGFLKHVKSTFHLTCFTRTKALLSKNSVAHIIPTNVAYGIAPFREKPTVMEAINKRMNVVVNFCIVP